MLHHLYDAHVTHLDCYWFYDETLTSAYVKLLADITRGAEFSPSSTTIAKFPSGERPTHAMFFVVETGNVSDVLLEEVKKKRLIPDLFFFYDKLRSA